MQMFFFYFFVKITLKTKMSHPEFVLSNLKFTTHTRTCTRTHFYQLWTTRVVSDWVTDKARQRSELGLIMIQTFFSTLGENYAKNWDTTPWICIIQCQIQKGRIHIFTDPSSIHHWLGRRRLVWRLVGIGHTVHCVLRCVHCIEGIGHSVQGPPPL